MRRSRRRADREKGERKSCSRVCILAHMRMWVCVRIRVCISIYTRATAGTALSLVLTRPLISLSGSTCRST